MAQTHYHSLPIEFYIAGEAVEIAVEIEFTINPGSPAHYGSMSYAGHPAEPAEIEVGKVELVVIDKTSTPPKEIRQDAPDWLANYIANSQAVYEALGQSCDWGENSGPDPDDWYDARFERAEHEASMGDDE